MKERSNCTNGVAWGMRSAERRKMNVPEMKCLRSLVGVSRIDIVRNKEVRRRAGIERQLASRADQRILTWRHRLSLLAGPVMVQLIARLTSSSLFKVSFFIRTK